MTENPAGGLNDPPGGGRVSAFLLSRHSVLDTESSRVFWIPANERRWFANERRWFANERRWFAFAGMTNSPQAAGNID